MTPNPILKVLSTFKKHNVKCLLIGGQACIIYGAAEFSRDSDFVILCSNENLRQLKKALDVLGARLIYVPPLEVSYLERGHACHFRCKEKFVGGLRIDVISKLRGCEPFEKLCELCTVCVFTMQAVPISEIKPVPGTKILISGSFTRNNVICP